MQTYVVLHLVKMAQAQLENPHVLVCDVSILAFSNSMANFFVQPAAPSLSLWYVYFILPSDVEREAKVDQNMESRGTTRDSEGTIPTVQPNFPLHSG